MVMRMNLSYVLVTCALVIGIVITGFSPASAITRHRATRRVLAAARNAIGTPYRYGSASLGGFDCSGLTMWAWSHGHISLPHSSAEQYQRIRKHVRRSHLQPGDLLFFYRPISHVALFIGHGRMIAASHTGTRVHRQDVEWGSFVGGARPMKRAWA